jgi:hypothetical protein
MREVFADAQYFVALINDKDQSHPAALAISRTLQGLCFQWVWVTTDRHDRINRVLFRRLQTPGRISRNEE